MAKASKVQQGLNGNLWVANMVRIHREAAAHYYGNAEDVMQEAALIFIERNTAADFNLCLVKLLLKEAARNLRIIVRDTSTETRKVKEEAGDTSEAYYTREVSLDGLRTNESGEATGFDLADTRDDYKTYETSATLAAILAKAPDHMKEAAAVILEHEGDLKAAAKALGIFPALLKLRLRGLLAPQTLAAKPAPIQQPAQLLLFDFAA